LLGLELEYDVEEKGPGHAKVFLCRVKLVNEYLIWYSILSLLKIPEI